MADIEIILKYPVVLVHGIARTDRGATVQSWGRIPFVLRENGIEVYFGNTDAWGSIESNAVLLKESIDSILENTSHEKVNIIAHSKGGIDSRYFIWKYDYGDKVASLVTISTPHHGAEISDLLYSSWLIHNESVKRRLLDIGRLFKDVNPDIYSVNENLTTNKMKEFNENVKMDDRIYFQSMYVVMDDPSDDPMYSFSFIYIKNKSGNNDGLVSARSASWGNNPVRIPKSLSHRQITDHEGDEDSGMDVPNIYLDIVRNLGRKGF